MFIGLFFLKESPRWLCKQGRHEKAIVSLAHIRCKTVDSPEIIQEMAEIRASIEEELNATEGVTWRECLTPGNRKRFAIGFMIMFWQQFSGTNSIGILSQFLIASASRLTYLNRLLRTPDLPDYRSQQS